nr:transposase [Halorhodospira abdelmalekii]
MSNGSVEGMNGQIQIAKGRARGFRTTKNLITICYLVCGKLTHLPASPYGTRCSSAVA